MVLRDSCECTLLYARTTVIAGVLAVASVSNHVLCELVGELEALVAERARVSALLRVRLLVLVH